MMMGPGMGPGRWAVAMCDPRAAGLVDWRMERIERAIQPTDAQRDALNELKSCIDQGGREDSECVSTAISGDGNSTARVHGEASRDDVGGGQDRTTRFRCPLCVAHQRAKVGAR